MIALATVHLVAISCLADSISHGKANGGEHEAEIRLDFQPLTDPIAVFVRVHEMGEAEAVRYSPYRREVMATFRGTLPKTDVAGLLSRMREAGFCQPLRSQPQAEIAYEGDLFKLSLKTRAGIQTCSGIVEQAPTVVRSVLQDLLTYGKRLKEAPLAEAYVRSERIEQKRFEQLRHSGKLRFASLSDLADDLQPIVAGAISCPTDFHPLSHAVYDRLLTWCSHGHDFFIIQDGSGYQLSLFSARHGA